MVPRHLLMLSCSVPCTDFNHHFTRPLPYLRALNSASPHKASLRAAQCWPLTQVGVAPKPSSSTCPVSMLLSSNQLGLLLLKSLLSFFRLPGISQGLAMTASGGISCGKLPQCPRCLGVLCLRLDRVCPSLVCRHLLCIMSSVALDSHPGHGAEQRRVHLVHSLLIMCCVNPDKSCPSLGISFGLWNRGIIPGLAELWC